MESTSNGEKLLGFEFWDKVLNKAKLVVAPMVDQSELPWRLLSRRHGAQLCYTPMFHASVFVRDANYRKDALASCAEDRPLIIQFCANNPDTLLKAARYAEGCCEAIDLNLGCPQAIAKRGHYGAFLQDDWELLQQMVSLCAKELKVPITCKIRIFDDISKTVRYAQMLEKAGCQLLTVHGRTKEQKGANTGIADWKYIKAVKDALKIPVYANGNIQYLEDVHRCMEETGVDGVMTAEGNLHNPALFDGKLHSVWDLAEEYLKLVQQYPCPMSCIRGHMFKLFHHTLLMHTSQREVLGNCKNVSEIITLIQHIKELAKPDVDRYEANPEKCPEHQPKKLLYPYWICQPYVRPNPEETRQKQKDKQNAKRSLVDVSSGPDEKPLSRNKMKKLRRNPNLLKERQEKFIKCGTCGNPRGQKCVNQFCKACCRKIVYRDKIDCPGHKIIAKKFNSRPSMEKTGDPASTSENAGLTRSSEPDPGKLSEMDNSADTDKTHQPLQPGEDSHLQTFNCETMSLDKTDTSVVR